MKLTIDKRGYDLIARDEEGNVHARVKTYCNPAALAQIVSQAEEVGEIDWEASQVAKPEPKAGMQPMKTAPYYDQDVVTGVWECRLCGETEPGVFPTYNILATGQGATQEEALAAAQAKLAQG